MSADQHPNHNAELRRIKRIMGQLEGVQKMILDRRYCVDILNQTKAISSAVHSLEAALLEKHLQHCVSAAFSASEQEREQKIKELLGIFQKRLK